MVMLQAPQVIGLEGRGIKLLIAQGHRDRLVGQLTDAHPEYLRVHHRRVLPVKGVQHRNISRPEVGELTRLVGLSKHNRRSVAARIVLLQA